MQRLISLFLCVSTSAGCLANEIVTDNFENGFDQWQASSSEHATIIIEPETGNQVLQLQPKQRDLSHVILSTTPDSKHLLMEGRLLFPTDGDGYLGFIYNYAPQENRSDYGVIYLKSNGSYLRVSPHYDGNPSWRLYEEQRVDLDGTDAIKPNTWYPFRLEVHGRTAALSIGSMDEPKLIFLEAPIRPGNLPGKLGLEARPGRGDPVWVDDIRVESIPPRSLGKPPTPPPARLISWQDLAAIVDPEDAAMQPPDLTDAGWQPISRDSRGMVLTAPHTLMGRDANSVVYLRTDFSAPEDVAAAWLALSSANRIDVWLDGRYYLGTVGPLSFTWWDYLENPIHAGARLPLYYPAGEHWLLLRVFGDRFASGGFYADLIEP